MNKALRDQVLSLPADEKLELVMDLWNSIEEDELPSPTDEQISEAERRFEVYLRSEPRNSRRRGDESHSGKVRVTSRLIVEEQAGAEILEVAAWYGRRNRVAREAFLRSIDASLAIIEASPLQYQTIRGSVPRVRVGQFPYALLYSVADDDVVVTVCIPTSCDPARRQVRFSP